MIEEIVWTTSQWILSGFSWIHKGSNSSESVWWYRFCFDLERPACNIHLTMKDTSKRNCVLHFPSQLFFLFKCIFNWRIIALQCFIGFCYTTMWISHKHTNVHSLLNLFPPPHLSSDCHRPPGWAPTQLAQLPTSYFTYGDIYVSMPISQLAPPSSPCRCVHKSVLYIYVSIPALQMCSSVPFFICALNIQYLFFSFWLLTLYNRL